MGATGPSRDLTPPIAAVARTFVLRSRADVDRLHRQGKCHKRKSPTPSASRRLRPNMVVTLPGSVDQQETERLGRAQIADFVRVTRRHGAERPRRHRNDVSSILIPVVNLSRTGDHEKKLPRSRVEVRRKLLPGVHTKQARFGFGDLMEYGLRTISVHVAAGFGEHVGY